MAERQTMIEARDVRFFYPAEEGQRNPPALDGVTLSIERGTFTVVLGHNGSGKSTFAKLCNAVLLPSGGAVYVEGLDTRDESLLLAVRQRVGMVFQNPDNQIVANVVEEDVAFAPENLGVPSEEIRRRVDDALKAVGMYEYVTHAPHMLSGGQKQRVAIAGVLAMEPECVVLDEATAMLDPMGRREVLRAVRALNREKGMTVVHITHHMNEAEDADRVVVMDNGRVALDGPPREVFAQTGRLRAMGLTVPDTVDLLDRLRRDGWAVSPDALTVDAAEEPQRDIHKGRNGGKTAAGYPGREPRRGNCKGIRIYRRYVLATAPEERRPERIGADIGSEGADAHLRRGDALPTGRPAGCELFHPAGGIRGVNRPHGFRQVHADTAPERPVKTHGGDGTAERPGHLGGAEENPGRPVSGRAGVPVPGVPVI